MNVLVSKYMHERVNIDKGMRLFRSSSYPSCNHVFQKKGKNIKLDRPVIEPPR